MSTKPQTYLLAREHINDPMREAERGRCAADVRPRRWATFSLLGRFTPGVAGPAPQRPANKLRNGLFAVIAAAMLCASPSFLGGASALARPVVVPGRQTTTIVSTDPATGLDAGCSVSSFVQAEIGYDPCSQDKAAIGGNETSGCSVSSFVQAEIGYDPCNHPEVATVSADPATVRVDPATALGAGGLDAGCSVSSFVQAEIGYDPCNEPKAPIGGNETAP